MLRLPHSYVNPDWLPARTYRRFGNRRFAVASSFLRADSLAYLGVNDTARTVAYMERAATGDGDLFVLFSTLTAAEIPRSSRTDAVWRRFHVDPARMVAPAKGARD